MYRFAKPLFGEGLGLALCGTALLCPLFLTQAGYMYLEMPLAACTVFALLSWTKESLIEATVWVALACWVKETGLIAAGTLVVAALLEPRPFGERLRRALMISAAPVVLAGLTVAYLNPQSGNPFALDYSRYVFVGFLQRVFYMPDLLAILVLVLYAGIFRRMTIWKGLRLPGNSTGPSELSVLAMRHRSLAFLLVYVFVTFFLTVPLTGKTYLVLPRFYVQIVPFLLILLADTVHRLCGRRTTFVALALLASFFVANRRGDFYPKEWDSFSLAERTQRYADFLDVQRMGINAIAGLSPEVPVFYGRPEHYMLSHPLMGYLPGGVRLANGHCVLLEAPYNRGNLEDYPAHFFLLYSNRWHGGEIMAKLLQQAAMAADRTVSEAAVFEQGGFRSRLIEIKTITTDAPAGPMPPLSEVPRTEAQVREPC
jgi:hypothetical protein